MSVSSTSTPTLSHTRGALPARWRGLLQQRARGYGYALAIALAVVVAIIGLPGTAPPSDPVYAPMAIALLVGMLLTVRLSPGSPAAALVVVPAMAVDARLGLAALPAVAYMALLANLTRGVRGPRVISTAGHLALAFAAADLCARIVPGVPQWAGFAVSFALLRLLLWHVALRLDASPPDSRAEKPEVWLSLLLAPIGLLPLAAGERLGDGALLLAIAALLALLFVVREAANLATARAEMESERDRLVRANALQDDMINLITHELRNPLTLVMSYAQMTRRAASEQSYDAIPAYVGNVERAGRSIQRLMENLLQLSRLERSDGLPPVESVNVASIISQVIADLAPLARQKQQTLQALTPSGLEPALVMPLLLREALSNLISNAVKYTPEGGIIDVWAEAGAEPHTIVLGVRDTGIGLSADDQTRLFTKFFRSSDPRVQRERGTGLGLALTHALVSRLGGKITVESESDQGTTFKLSLPAGERVST
jgi:signal transduction histidine kinase